MQTNHADGQIAPTVQDFGDSGPRADQRLQILAGEALLLHSELDRFDRVRWITIFSVPWGMVGKGLHRPAVQHVGAMPLPTTHIITACVGGIGPMSNDRWPNGGACSTTAVPVTPFHTSTLDPRTLFATMDSRVDHSEVRVLTHQEARLIVFGIMLPVFMGSLDNTILASALPTIGRDFGDTHSLPWLITIYLLASTAVVPLYGKISDIHGRGFTLRIALAIYMAGSLLSALAPNMMVLILGRALHGLGGGGLASMGATILGDVASPKERGRYYAYFAVVYTTAGASGPVLGGFLAEYVHWSAIFWLNIPFGIAALIVTSVMLRRLPRHERPHRLDVIGAMLIVTASVSFMLALNLGGRDYPWLSPPVLTLFLIAAGVGMGFVWRLRTAPEPLIPIDILRSPTARRCVVVHAFGWGSIVGLNIFLPMYLQNVAGLSATTAGLSLMALMIALNMSAGTSGYFLGRMVHYKMLPIIGAVVAIGATTALAWWVDRLSLFWFELLLVLIGVGFGPVPGLAQVVLQNTLGRHQLGIAVGTMTFSRNLLATMLVALFGAIVAGSAAAVGTPTPGAIGGMLDADAAMAAEGFRWVFFTVAATLAVALVAILVLEEKPLQSDIVPETK